LRVGANATSLSASITIYAKFLNNDFAVINPTGVSIVPQGGMMGKGGTNYNLENVVINGSLDAKTGGDSFSGGSTTVTPGDRPNLNFQPVPFRTQDYPTLTNAVSVDYATHLDLCAGSLPLVKPQSTGTPEDEMDFRAQCRKLAYRDKFVLSVANTLGDSLYVMDLCPCAEFFYLPAATSVTLSKLSFMCLPFSFWRGSLVVKIIAVASPAHTARLTICSHVGFESSGLTVNEVYGQYTSNFDIGGGTTEVSIVFPWRSQTEWKKMNNGTYNDSRPYSMGQFSIRVLNSLQAPETVSNAIDLMVYYGGGADFEVAYLGTNSRDCTVLSV